jgi:prefoldin subunit 5
MEKELNYLSEKIEELKSERDFIKRLLKVSNYEPAIKEYTRSVRHLDSEIEVLDNILTVVTNYALAK